MFHINPLQTIKTFFATKLSHQVRELYVSATMMNFAAAMVAIFEPIFLYQQGFSLSKILYFYLAIYSAYLFMIPLGAKFARRFGYEKSILLGSPFLAVYYISLYLISINPLFIFVAIVAFVLQKSFYWPGFHADFARFGKNSERGREISNIMAVTSIVLIAGPFIGGFIIATWGFKLLFTVATVIILASNLALLSTPEKFKPIPYSYTQSFKRLLARENRRNFYGYLGFGDELIGMVIWPIFIFTVISNFLSIGSLVALATLTTTFVLLFVGRMVDGRATARRSILKMGVVFKSGVWVLRTLVQGPLGVFVTDALGRTTKNVIMVPMMAMTYDHASETSVMKTIIFFEMSLIIGKILAIVLSLVVLAVVPGSFAALFVVAGLMTLLYSLIRYEPVKLGREH
jgi:MFS family permease